MSSALRERSLNEAPCDKIPTKETGPGGSGGENPITYECQAGEALRGTPFFQILTHIGVVCVKLPKKTFNANGSCTEASDENSSRSHFACKVALHEFNSSLDMAIKKSVDSGEQFVSSIRDYLLAKVENLLQFVEGMFTLSRDSDGKQVLSLGGVSLFRALIKVETIQTWLIDVILEVMVIYAAADTTGVESDTNDPESNSVDGKNLTKIILGQLQWIEQVYDTRKLANKLLECLDVCPIDSQRDIIGMIPDIIDDAEQESTVERLFEIMENEITLTVPILDSISNLYLSSEKKEEANERVLNLLSSSSIDDLPIIIRFLIDGCNTDNAANVLNMMRKHMSRLVDTINSNDGLIVEDGDDRISAETFLLESFRSSLRYRQDIASHWIKLIDQSNGRNGINSLCSIDFWILVMLHNTKVNRQSVHKVLKKKAATEVLSYDFVHLVLNGHGGALASLFASFMDVSSLFFYAKGSSKEHRNIRKAGQLLYVAMFREFSSDYHRQEIVGNLITHIGSGVDYEIESALKTLENMLDDPTMLGGLKKFVAFIRGLLDYVEYLNTQQQRSVFKILTTLSLPSLRVTKPSASNGNIDEVTIIVRKMLASTLPQVKKVGIVGGVAILCVVSSVEKVFANQMDAGASQSSIMVGTQSLQSTEKQNQSNSFFRKLSIDMLRMLQDNCSKSNGGMNAMAVFYEELALVISTNRYGKSGLSKSLQSILMDTFSSRLERECFIDIPASALQSEIRGEKSTDSVTSIGSNKAYVGGSVVSSFQFNLDLTHAQVAVNILPLLASRRIDDENNVWSMCPLFRLISVLETEVNGDLGGVDACLGCPLALFDDEILKDLQLKSRVVKDLVCNALYAAVNWIREMLNSFVKEVDIDMRSKVFLRGNHLLALESKLRIALCAHPAYRPPAYSFSISNEKRSTFSGLTKRKRFQRSSKHRSKKKVKPKKKKKKSHVYSGEDEGAEEHVEDNNDHGENVNVETKADTAMNKGSKYNENFDIVFSSLRPLDAEVANLVSLSEMKRKVVDANSETLSRTSCALSPKLLNFILDHILHWYRLCMPKTTSNSFLSSVKRNKGNSDSSLESAEELLEKFTTDVACLVDKHEIHQRSVLQTVSVCFQDVKEHLKSHGTAMSHSETKYDDDDDIVLLSVQDDLDKSLLLTCVHKIFSCIKIMCECVALRESEKGILLLSKALLFFDENIDEHLEEGKDTQAFPPYKSLFNSCQMVFDSLHEIYSLLPSIDDDVLPLLEAMEAVTNLQNIAFKEHNNIANENNSNALDADELVSIRLSQLCRRILEKDWRLEANGSEKFRYKMGNLGWTVFLHLKHAKNPLDAVEYIVQDVLSHFLELDSPSDVVEHFPTMTKQSIPIFFVKLLESLVDAIRTVDFKSSNQKVALFQLRKIAIHLQTVVQLTKSDSLVTVSMMTNALKNMRSFIDVVNKNMDFFNACFASKQEDVLSFFKALQTSTRQIHNICSYGKNEKKNNAIARLVPFVKKSMEEFIYRVKGMLVANGSVDSFWAGNLKQRNLDGSEWKRDETPEQSDSDYSGGDEEN